MNSTLWKIALRTLVRDKSYALINVAGLAIAVACCLILGVYLRSELTYDQSHENYRRIFRVVNQFEINGKQDSFARTAAVLGPMLKDENADVQAYVRFLGGGASRNFLTHGADGYYWRDTYVVDTNVFEVFTHKILYGDPKTALDSPSSIAISHSVARHYFGERDPIGETLSLGRQRRAGHARVRGLAGEHAPPVRRAVLGEPRNDVGAGGHQHTSAAALRRQRLHVSADAPRLRPCAVGRSRRARSSTAT